MEIKNISKAENIYKKFIFLLLLMFGLIVISIICLIIIANVQNEYLFGTIFVIMITMLFGIGILLLGIIFNVMLLRHDYPVPKISRGLLRLSLKVAYPGLLFLNKLLGYDKDFIRKIFIELNNKSIFIDKYSIEGNDILILIPHCIQKTFCPHRITTNIGNCKRCGKCKIGDLIKLKEEFGVNVRVATGGTLAQKIVKDLKPKAVIGIACERDLISGLNDIGDLPAIAITNIRPEGPCVNTSVDIDEVRTAIKHFLYEE
ncbi:MAG: DUF116 domain-containing protein [Alkaliphilus sp.]|nr:DUF116 domain-containing protein [Alkaliphilus sp.]